MKLIVKTLYGLEEVLAKELALLGIRNIKILNRAVSITGNKETMYMVNYRARTAMSVLLNISSFKIRSKDDLYRKCLDINWSSYMGTDSTFSVVSVSKSLIFKHTAYPALIVKDAIADYFRTRKGIRPTVDTNDPSVIVNVHISNDNVDISLDSSGEPLYKRGYRKAEAAAPLNEVLTAGILYISGWNMQSSLTDPMCGSGTIPVEAALMACRIPPGKFRKSFGFTRWMDYDDKLFEDVKKKADEHISVSNVSINASDVSEKAVSQTVSNLENAGLSDLVNVKVSDLRDIRPEGKEGFLFLNPPYGERMQHENIEDLYRMIGSSLKHNFSGHHAWIITTKKEYLGYIGLKTNSKHILYNGPIKCILAEYELYSGTRK